jgi:hypothetical protein
MMELIRCSTKIACVVLVCASALGQLTIGDHLAYEQEDGLRLPAIPESLRNPWPEEWERAFQKRAAEAIRFFDTGGKGRYGTTYFESEKSSYPRAMFDFLAGHRQQALAYLQAEDADAQKWHAHTLGIDLYPCFTLKGQVRKYFLFGPFLDPDYRRRMYEAAKIWTAEDPAQRPHPMFGRGRGGEGWTPEIRGFWVDKRSTDNLRVMREVAVYLFAEETGNRATQELYRERLIDYVASLYRIGMSEWDSENYLSHGISAWLNLYDFAKDEKMKALAKAALDWLCTAAALKYYRGGMLGPCARDYGGGNAVLAALSSHMFYLWFGDCPISDPHPADDNIHVITSRYRPPQAVVHLARKDFPRPVEMINTKPTYAYWSNPQGRSRPRFWETLYIAQTYQLGSLAAESLEGMPLANYRVMSLGAWNSRRGVDYVILQTDPPDQHATMKADERLAQYRNVLVWIKDTQPGTRFYLQLPKHAVMQTKRDALFIGLEKTFLCIRSFGLGSWQPYPEKTSEIYKDEVFLSAEASKPGLCGVVLEVVEGPGVETLDDLISQSHRASLDLSRLQREREVSYRAISGLSLRVQYRQDTCLPVMERDGTPFRLENYLDVYRAMDVPKDEGPVMQGWNSGQLAVRAGGRGFTMTVAPDGTTKWSEQEDR